MRTTVTLDDDVERLLREEMHQSGRSFKETLNAAVRSGIGSKRALTERKPFVVHAQAMELLPGIDPTSFNKLIDDLEIDANVERMHGIQNE